MNWKGEILLETLNDPTFLDRVNVESVEEIQDEDGLWHNYHVSVEEDQITSLGSFLKEGPWFMHFGNEEKTAVVFKDRHFIVLNNDQSAIEKVKQYARALDIPEEELHFNLD